jgi:hypothetical protein
MSIPLCGGGGGILIFILFIYAADTTPTLDADLTATQADHGWASLPHHLTMSSVTTLVTSHRPITAGHWGSMPCGASKITMSLKHESR